MRSMHPCLKDQRPIFPLSQHWLAKNGYVEKRHLRCNWALRQHHILQCSTRTRTMWFHQKIHADRWESKNAIYQLMDNYTLFYFDFIKKIRIKTNTTGLPTWTQPYTTVGQAGHLNVSAYSISSRLKQH